MFIRQARASDAGSIAHLHAESWRTAYRGALSDAYLAGPIETERVAVWRARFESSAQNQYVAVAESRDQIVGFVCAYGGHDPQWGTLIDNLHVLPEHKRQGFGAQLMAHVASWSAKAYPGQGMYLWVLESNLPAQRFYARIGGEQAGRDTWTPPDGSALPKLKYAWSDAAVLRLAMEKSFVQ
ncbi:MAG TPA: GNAT family N-acetyltransferase [Burkholderiales bacterium]|nr:GNAT family N-acetyltransferase [Burkholderiales bacterium]